MNELRNKSVETLAIRLLSQAFSVAASIILARVLGAYGKGVMTYTATVTTLLQTAWSGQSAAASWQYGRLKAPSAAVARAVLKVLLWGGVPIAFVVLAIGVAMPGQRPLIAVAASLPFAFFSMLASGFFLADGNVRIGNIQTLITQVGYGAALAVVLLIAHGGLTAALTTWVATFVVAAGYAAWKFRPYLRSASGTYPVNDLIAKQVRFGVRASVSAVVWLLNWRIDIFIIMYALGLRSLGIYSVGLSLGELTWQLSNALTTSAFGRITTASPSEAARLTAKCSRHAFAMVLFAGLVIYFIGPALIVWAYGPAFAAAGPVVRVILPGIVAYSMSPFLATFFTQQLGKPAITTTIGAFSICICTLVTLLTIKPLGVVSGALGTSVSYVAAFLIAAHIFTRATRLPFTSLVFLDAEDWREYQRMFRGLVHSVQRPRA